MKTMSFGKTILIPLFIAVLAACSNSGTNSRAEAFEHLAKAVSLNNEATMFSNQFASVRDMSAADLARLRALRAAALVEARKVDIAIISADEPEFANIYRDKFVHALELCTEGRDHDDLIQCQLRLDQFSDALDIVKSKHR